jgi:hypothetical protein
MFQERITAGGSRVLGATFPVADFTYGQINLASFVPLSSPLEAAQPFVIHDMTLTFGGTNNVPEPATCPL